MTSGLLARVRAARRGDAGSALLIALAILVVVGMAVGVLLSFLQTSFATTGAVRSSGAVDYAADGAVDGAINALQGDLTKGGDSYDATCFSLPAGSVNGNAQIDVRCTGKTGSGKSAYDASRQPTQTVLTTGGGTSVSAGVNRVDGPVSTNTLTVATGTPASGGPRLAVTNGVLSATACTPAAPTNVTPAPNCTGSAPSDPGYPYPGSRPATVTQASTCPTGSLVDLKPGTYTNAGQLQTLVSCANKVIWFEPGVYNFEFTDASSHTINLAPAASTVVVAGLPAGWTPGVTAPTGVPTTPSGCDQSKPGVVFVLSGDAALSATTGGAKVQICAWWNATNPGQHLAVYAGTTSQPAVTGQVTGVTSATAANDAGNGPGNPPNWDNASAAAAVDGASASVSVNTSAKSGWLDISNFNGGNPIVPSGSVVTALTVSVTHAPLGSTNGADVRAQITDNSGVAIFSSPDPWFTCGTGQTCNGKMHTDTITFPMPSGGLPDTSLNNLSIRFLAESNGQKLTETIDGVTMNVTYQIPAYKASAAGTTVLSASGSGTFLAIHGTVYAPAGTISLTQANVPATVVDRGVVAKSLTLGTTPASGFTGPVLSNPPLQSMARDVVLTATSGGATLLEAEVTFDDGVGGNGRHATVISWSHQ